MGLAVYAKHSRACRLQEENKMFYSVYYMKVFRMFKVSHLCNQW